MYSVEGYNGGQLYSVTDDAAETEATYLASGETGIISWAKYIQL